MSSNKVKPPVVLAVFDGVAVFDRHIVSLAVGGNPPWDFIDPDRRHAVMHAVHGLICSWNDGAVECLQIDDLPPITNAMDVLTATQQRAESPLQSALLGSMLSALNAVQHAPITPKTTVWRLIGRDPAGSFRRSVRSKDVQEAQVRAQRWASAIQQATGSACTPMPSEQIVRMLSALYDPVRTRTVNLDHLAQYAVASMQRTSPTTAWDVGQSAPSPRLNQSLGAVSLRRR
jgi:hypothetical protein